MKKGFFDGLLNSFFDNITATRNQREGFSDISEELLLTGFLSSAGRQDIAAKITPSVRAQIDAISPLRQEAVIIPHESCDPVFIKADSKENSYVIDSHKKRILTIPAKRELAIPVFEIHEQAYISLYDIRHKDIFAARIAFGSALLRVIAQELVLCSSLLSRCCGVKKKYLVIHTDLTVIECCRPEFLEIGFTLFKNIGLAVTEERS